MRRKGLSAADDAESESAPASLTLAAPGSESQATHVWSLTASNRRVLKGWEQLCRDTPANAINAHDWLARNAMTRKPGRCYPLRHAKYAGHWCYEIGAGDRLYYTPDAETQQVVVWYAGRHPEGRIPDPPKAL
jgi:hypothetical protein